MRVLVRISGSNLAAKDRNGLSDPYAMLYRADTRELLHKLPVQEKTLNPVWKRVIMHEGDSVYMELFDKDVLGRDRMGCVSFAIPKYTEAGRAMEVPVKSVKREVVSGTVIIKCTYKCD
jgi:phosphatidylserine decarboxylase